MVLRANLKKSILLVLILGLVGCSSTNPPQPNKAKGEWVNVITTPAQLKAL